jgi:CDP-glucose 4,6-dehydratase
MGGHDPYSASKGAAELVTASYRKSFFPPDNFEQHGVSLSSVRAGNVIGGGDWSKDRLIPDCILSLKSGQSVVVRNPQMIRPWQHVLEPIAGYLWLAIRMRKDPVGYAGAWNFGPCADESKTVRDVVNQVVAHWGSGQWELPLKGCQAPHEDMSLRLDSTKAANLLGWKTVLSVRESVQKAVMWYRAYYQDPNFNGYDVTTHNIADYVRTAQQAGIRWAM